MVNKKQKYNGFTIVELLVVIVVVGILAAITIVSYSGISNKAVAASLQSDLNNNAKLLKMYNVEYGYYPNTLDTNKCPSTPTADTRYCLKFSSDTTFTYSGANNSFRVTATKSGQTYRISDESIPIAGSGDVLTALSVPTIAAQSNPAYIAMSNDGTSVYVTNQLSATISMYSRNTSTGILTALSTPTIGTGANPRNITISFDGKSVYVSGNPNSIYMYSRNTSTGTLTALGTPTVAAGNYPAEILISSDGKSVYVANISAKTISMYSRNILTGLLTALSTPTIATATYISDIAISNDGVSLYATDNFIISTFSRNVSSGILTSVATPTAAAKGVSSVIISPDGKFLYGLGRDDDSNLIILTYSRDNLTGSLTALGTLDTNIMTSSFGMAISSDGTSAYVPDNSNDSVFMYSRNTSTGALTTLGTPKVAAGDGPINITISADGSSVYVLNAISNTISMYKR